VEGAASALVGGETTVRVFLAITARQRRGDDRDQAGERNIGLRQAGNAALATQTTGAKTLNDQIATDDLGQHRRTSQCSYKQGDVLSFTVVFTKDVTVTARPDTGIGH